MYHADLEEDVVWDSGIDLRRTKSSSVGRARLADLFFLYLKSIADSTQDGRVSVTSEHTRRKIRLRTMCGTQDKPTTH